MDMNLREDSAQFHFLLHVGHLKDTLPSDEHDQITFTFPSAPQRQDTASVRPRQVSNSNEEKAAIREPGEATKSGKRRGVLDFILKFDREEGI